MVRQGPAGQLEVVVDNTPAIEERIAEQNARVPRPPADVPVDTSPRNCGGGVSVCAVSAAETPDPSWALVLVALGFALRRRRS